MAWHGKFRPGLLLLLFSFVVISEAMAKSVEAYRYETAYACEGKTLKIECKEGEVIKLIRANYGRFSITICNDHGNTDWSVNCMSPKSLRVLHGRCTHYQNCSIPASTSMFGDPCPGTHKYLEAHYQCLPATTTTTTSRPSPPWLITSQPPMWSTVKPSARPPPPPLKVTVTSPSRPPTTSTTPSTTSSTSLHPIVSSHDEERDEGPEPNTNFDESVKPIPDEITTLPFTTISPKGATSDGAHPNTRAPPSSVLPSWTRDAELGKRCGPKIARSISWKWTKVNSTDVQPCPPGTNGFAKWQCVDLEVPTRYPATPDLSQCRSVWLSGLDHRLDDGLQGKEGLVKVAEELASVTGSKALYGGDMMLTTKMIQKMVQKLSQDPRTRHNEVMVTEMLNHTVETGSNLLDSSQPWRDLSYKDQMRVATSLLIGLEESAFLLADIITRKQSVDRMFKNIMLSVRVLETKTVTDETFPSDDRWAVNNDSIELSQRALQENSDGGLIRLVYVAFDRLEHILQWQPESSESTKNISRMLNSKVISASLGKGRHIQLKEPVRLTLKHLQTENVSNPSCVFWDYTTSAWLEEGCHVDSTNKSHTVCLCDHLTNFAILMDVHAIHLPMSHQITLKIFTFVGCIVSIVCLVLAIVTFQLFRGLKSDRTTIHCNLCICLLIAELIFLIGIGQTESKVACGVIAGFLQYFFLCAFMWMFFEGFQLYVMLIEVFEAEKSRLKWYYFFAYGLPLLIVLISAAVYPQGYGTELHCWLKTNNYFIYSFVGPVIVVLLLNLVFLTMAVVMMCRHASASVSIKNKEHSRLASTRARLFGAIILVFLLGLTWSFGFLYINQESVAMAYLFTILNSLQGFFIFVFHCVQNEKVRKEYRKFIRRHSWLPKCLRCSKSGSGGSSSSGSSGLNKERRTSVYAGSNGNPSGTNSHSTDNSVLSPHGTSNISFKSYSRDSGHGGSEQEDSPRSHGVVADTRLNNAKDARRQGLEGAPMGYPEFGRRHDAVSHPKHLPLPQSLQHGARKKNGGFPKAGAWPHHTYTEIYDGRPRGLAPEDDPVYEEIERSEIQVSDMSDEDGKRQSDMSRQSSRSYGDHRPLIPYSPGADRSILEAVRMRPNMYRGDNVRSLAAVLDGETVVCHLEPPEMYPRDPYTARTLVLPQYSES